MLNYLITQLKSLFKILYEFKDLIFENPLPPDEIANKAWVNVYINFLSSRTSLKEFKLRFRKELPFGVEGMTIFNYIFLTTRARTCLKQNIFHREGAFIFFQQIAYAEFWNESPFFFILYIFSHKKFDRWAVGRAEQLLHDFKSFKQKKYRSIEKYKLG